MTMPDQRRRDPVPAARGGEVVFVVIAAVLLALALAALLGIGLAAAWFGHGWVWPHGIDTIGRVLGGLLSGHPGRGLDAGEARRLPGDGTIYSCVAACEFMLVAAGIAGSMLALRWVRPGDARRGMASRAEAQRVLGKGRLHSSARLIRPDLHRAGRFKVTGFHPVQCGWRLGRSHTPRGGQLWVRYDRTAGVYGAQGSGKTLDLLAPALLAHPGAALVTLTKSDDLLLTLGRRRLGDRPIAVLDPFGTAPGVPELIWDPIAGCVDPLLAERRAKAFAAGTVTGSVAGGRNDNSARFYAHETAKVLQGFFHAAALTGRSLEHVMEWVANPVGAEQPIDILRQHPHAARHWDGLLSGALAGSNDTVSNTVTTVQQAMGLFFQPAIRRRCVPSPGRPATDIAALITAGGTAYLLGREDPYAPASPLMTAVSEHILDTALGLATASPYGRLCPPFLACLDELPSTAPLPTLRVRMANERALGLTFIYAAQTWRQMVVCYGEDEARSLLGLTNNLVVFGSGKDIHFYKEMSDLLGTARISRQSVSDGPGGIGTNRSLEDVPILRPEQLRLMPERHALVVAENAPPVIARLRRCLDGKDGQALARELDDARARMAAARAVTPDPLTRTAAAVAYAHDHRLHPSPGRDTATITAEWVW